MRSIPDLLWVNKPNSKEVRVDRCERHEVVLEAIRLVLRELRDFIKEEPEFTGKTFEILHRLITLYACLEVEDLKVILNEFRTLDQRKQSKLPRYKKAA